MCEILFFFFLEKSCSTAETLVRFPPSGSFSNDNFHFLLLFVFGNDEKKKRAGARSFSYVITIHHKYTTLFWEMFLFFRDSQLLAKGLDLINYVLKKKSRRVCCRANSRGWWFPPSVSSTELPLCHNPAERSGTVASTYNTDDFVLSFLFFSIFRKFYYNIYIYIRDDWRILESLSLNGLHWY